MSDEYTPEHLSHLIRFFQAVRANPELMSAIQAFRDKYQAKPHLSNFYYGAGTRLGEEIQGHFQAFAAFFEDECLAHHDGLRLEVILHETGNSYVVNRTALIALAHQGIQTRVEFNTPVDMAEYDSYDYPVVDFFCEEFCL